MARFMNMMRSLAASRPARWVGGPVLVAAALASVLSQSQITPPPTVTLAAEPLYARGVRAKPTLTLALSVEFPTVGAQYRNTTYLPTEKYIGYFDTESCYTYRNDPDPQLRRFDRAGDATGRSCGDAAFSGNFMNWATGSAIDVLRLGLTGGDRVVDTASLTVLQRAILPNTSVSTSFYNGSYFPSKRLTAAQAVGAVPKAMRDQAAGDIFIANCENKVFFGTQATGTCAAPGNNANLVAASSGTSLPNPGFYNGSLPSGFTLYATESSSSTPPSFSFASAKQIIYGVCNGVDCGWAVMTLAAGTSMNCTNSWFDSQSIPGVTNGDPLNGTVKACYQRDPVLSTDNFFYTRVRVCDNSGAALTDPRPDLCQRYPSGNYKPVGNLQKYSDRLRVAAFGYLNDNTGAPNQRYGGVLRAPMKYVGPKSFDANFSLQSGANPVAEWNESTGVFAKNPQGQTSINSGSFSNAASQPISGVVNYLNQFGRTGIFGQYKGFDPVGELYYESLRYLQGLPPTANAVSGMNDTLRDGFPVYDTWLSTTAPDPHPPVSNMSDYSCVRNNIIGIGDVFTHNDKSIPGNNQRSTLSNDFVRNANEAGNEPDFHFWTKVVGGFESNTSFGYTDGKGASRTTSNFNSPANTARWGMENQGTGSGSSSAYYMAGMAYWANTHDIRGTQWSDTAKRRPGMRVTTYMIDVNENSSSSDPTFRQNRHFYLAAKYGGFRDTSETGNPFKERLKDGTVVDSNANWANASGEAKNYFLASSAQAVLDSLDAIFENIAIEANSIAGGAISTQRLTTSGGLVYQAQFDPADWSGDLIANPVSLAASGTAVAIAPAASSPWRNSLNQPVGAAGKLDDITDLSARKIFVGFKSTAATPVFDSADFTWGAALPAVVKDAMKVPPGASAPTDSDTIAEARLNYLRGERASEAGGSGIVFRKRGSRLGDIVNSAVAFSGAPTRRISDASYNASGGFYQTYKDRVKALYVGANDGMLHAFNADTGAELFAYIPSWVLPKLTALTSATYTHQSYVDGSPAVAEANLGSTASADWRTVLVSGTGGGGQGVFALDVSDPAAFAGSDGKGNVLWEFTDRDDADMGNVVGKPQILKVNTAAGGSTPSYSYFAVVASGVNNQAADGASSTGNPALFFLKLGKPKSDPWALGDNYFKVVFPLQSNTIASGMAGFSVRVGPNDELAYLYAGDLQGALWKLDFTKTSAAAWTIDALSSFKNSGTALPMFLARDSASTPNLQPITMEPALIFGQNRSIIVAFGTGKFLEVSDTAAPYKAQSVYALLDNNSRTVDAAGTPVAAIAGRGRLMGATSVDATTIAVDPFNWGRPTADGSTSSRAGWYFDFNGAATTTSPAVAGTGERQISGFEVLAGKLFFGSVIPPLNTCDNGSGKLYKVDVLTGDGTSNVSSVGILGQPFIMRLGSSSTLTNSSSTGVRSETTRYQIILQGSAGITAPPSETVTGSVGRLSWREISNYQNLRNSP